jgi:hypothetical protein
MIAKAAKKVSGHRPSAARISPENTVEAIRHDILE